MPKKAKLCGVDRPPPEVVAAKRKKLNDDRNKRKREDRRQLKLALFAAPLEPPMPPDNVQVIQDDVHSNDMWHPLNDSCSFGVNPPDPAGCSKLKGIAPVFGRPIFGLGQSVRMFYGRKDGVRQQKVHYPLVDEGICVVGAPGKLQNILKEGPSIHEIGQSSKAAARKNSKRTRGNGKNVLHKRRRIPNPVRLMQFVKKKFDLDNIPDEPSVLAAAASCRYCHAKRIQYEPPAFCCGQGQVCLPYNEPPDDLYDLFFANTEEAQQFQKYIRSYNNMIAFTSLGISYDEKLANSIGTGQYCFKIHGQVHHYIDPLVVYERGPCYLQLYYYDPMHEVHNRARISSAFNESVIEKVLDVLRSNPYCVFFRSLHTLPSIPDATIVIRSDPALDQNVYNRPDVSEIAFIWPDEENSRNIGPRDIVVHGSSKHKYNVRYYYGCYDPLQYPLLFPNGETGWHEGIHCLPKGTTGRSCMGEGLVDPRRFPDAEALLHRESEVASLPRSDRKKKTVSIREYYAYLFQIRPKRRNLFLASRRLLQQFAVDMYVKMESQRLDFLRLNQKRIRSELYQGIMESIAAGETRASKVGKRVVLPPTFIGGPRDMRRRFLDAMALVKEFGKPDIFLTMTCNPNWKEIKAELLPKQTWQDRPDLVARVFRAKLEQLKEDLLKKEIFGPVQAHVYVVEFQKRGLPHVHFLLIMHPSAKLSAPAMFDRIVTAELPDKESHPYLWSLVKDHMIHGPCGSLNRKCGCMQKKNKCRFDYPKKFNDETAIGGEDYPLYRRRNDGRFVKVRGHRLDNRWVVPYNPYLLARYGCHINVEVCSTIKAVKYLYKYVYKGHDRVAFCLSSEEIAARLDEIELYQKGRWVTAPEAMWRLFGFRMYGMQPSVLGLHLHLPNKQKVHYGQTQNLERVAESDKAKRTMLTEFFRMNSVDPLAIEKNLLYTEFSRVFRWNKGTKTWTRRKGGVTVPRLHNAGPLDGERYYLRLLLCNVRGPKSFTDLLTLHGKLFATFREAAEAHGLTKRDDSLDRCLADAVAYQMPNALRDLFATILAHFTPTNAQELWAKYETDMCEDFIREKKMTATQAKKKALVYIARYLDGMGKAIQNYGLDLMDLEEAALGIDKEIEDELAIPVSLADLLSVSKLNESQKKSFDLIMEAVNSGSPAAFFLDGPGGTGKTFLYCALLATIRSKNEIALATASSGVAASLLPGGRTAHSRFKIPLDNTSAVSCNVSAQSGLGRLIHQAKLIIWDEAGMAHNRTIEAVEAMLRDIEGNSLPFGGKVIVFGGDFRQVLPVVSEATREDAINASLVKSHLWKSLKVLRLTENMRARQDPAFAEYLMRIGDGIEPMDHASFVTLPKEMVIDGSNHCDSLVKLTDFVFPGLRMMSNSLASTQNNAILTPKNNSVDAVNEELLHVFPGEFRRYKGFDEAVDPQNQSVYEDLMHNFTPSGMAPYDLKLKINCPIMLLRNINSSRGLCNGTRLVCRNFTENLILAEIICGDHKGELVFINKIPLVPGNGEKFPIQFERTQFPVRPSFAMTINKAQGQTLDTVGLYLPKPVFSHGQLYVALSRARLGLSVKVLTAHAFDEQTDQGKTANIVYRELLSLVGDNSIRPHLPPTDVEL